MNEFKDLTPEQIKSLNSASTDNTNVLMDSPSEYNPKDNEFDGLARELKREKRREQGQQRLADYDDRQQQREIENKLSPINQAIAPINRAVADQKWNDLWKETRLAFKNGRLFQEEIPQQELDEEFKRLIALDAKRRAVGNVLDSVYANGQTADEYKKILDRARILNVNPSKILGADSETLSSIDKTIERGSIKIADIDTPVTLDIYTNYNLAALGRDSIQNSQTIEWNLSKMRTDERLEEERKIQARHSTSLWDNAYYGFERNSVFVESLLYRAADFFNSNPYDVNRRNWKLINSALMVEELPQNMKLGEIVNQYDKSGFLSATGYVATNLDIIPSMLSQFAPSLAFGGLGGKGGAALMERLLMNRVVGQGTRSYLTTAGAMMPTIATATTTGSYSGNLSQSYRSTGDVDTAVERARIRTTIEAGTDALFALTPLPSHLINGLRGTRAGSIANTLTTTVAQSTSAGLGTYGGAKATNEEITGGEIFVNVFMNALFAPIELATATRTGGRDFSHKSISKLQTILSTVDEFEKMPLTAIDAETSKQAFKELHTAYNDGNPREVFVPVEKFVRYFQEQGVDPNEIAKKITGKEDALEKASTTGEDLVIPIENYAEMEASGYKGLRDDVKVDTDGVSIGEHKQFIKENKSRAENLIKEAVGNAERVVSDIENSPVYSNVKQQLIDIGRTKEAAQVEAMVVHSFFSRMAELAGVEAGTLFNKYNLKIARDGVSREGATVYGKDGNTKHNGFIDIAKDGSVRINLTDTENRTTFIHETGHFFLNVLSDIENMKLSNNEVRAINKSFKEWLNTDDLRKLTTDQHEKFARGFEAYLFEGKSPSIELRNSFKHIKQWMRSIYQALVNLNVRLNNDVRKAFDRILASDEAIKLAESYNQDLFATAERMGVSQKEFDLYKKTQRKAHDEAEEKLTTKALKEITREKTAEWKAESQQVREQVIESFQESNNLYALDDYLTKGIIDDNGNTQLQKLDREAVKAVYGDDIAKQLRRFTQKDGLNPDDIAKLFSFNSTDEMIQQLVSKPNNKEMVNSETRRIMLDRHGDMLNDGTLERLAIETVETEDAKAKILHAEELAIRKQAILADRVARVKVAETKAEIKEQAKAERQAQREAEQADKEAKKAAYASTTPDDLLRELSDQIVSTTRIADLKPDLYLQAMRKANREAVKAVDKGDWEAAANAKEQERLNYYLYKHALKGARSADTAYSYVKKLNRKSMREAINKSSPEALEQIDRLTEQYQFKRVSDKEITFRQNLRNYLDTLDAEGLSIDVPDFILDNHLSVNYRELSVEQLQELHNTLKGMVNVARLQNKLIAENKSIAFKEARAEIVDSIKSNIPINAKGKATSRLSETVADKAYNLVNKFNANMASLATICQRLDGGNADGPVSRLLYKPLLMAELRQKSIIRKQTQTLSNLLKGVDGGYLKQKTIINSLGGQMIAKGEAIMVALNSGNSSNKSRLLTGGIKVRDSVRALPLTEQAIGEVLGTLTKNDWQLVQSIWQMFEDMKPETKELYRALNGTEFKEVEVGVIQTPFGEIKGGYFPLMYDTDVATVPSGVQKQTVFKEGRTSSLTNNGYTKARAEKVTGTVNLDINVFPSKLNEHVLDLTHRKALIDANKILTDKEISATIKQKMGVNYYNAMFESIRDIANPSTSKGIGAWAGWLQKNAATYYLGFSMSSMINQFAGTFQQFKYVNAIDYANEVANIAGGNFGETVARIMDLSPAMADRWAKMDLSRSALSKLEGKGKIAVTHENIQTIALAYMPVFEKVFAAPAWMAIYKRELGLGKTQEQAVMTADSAVVKSQGGFNQIDKNYFQRNKAMAPFYMFASPFIAVYNGLIDSAHAVRQGRASLLRETMTNLAVMSLAGFGYSLMTGQKDDDEGYTKFYLKSTLSYATAGMPVIRDIINFAVDAKGRSAISMPASSTVTDIINQAKRLKNPERVKVDRTAASLFAITGTPLKPLTVQGAAIKDIATGDYKPKDFLDGVRHILYRKNKPK